MQETKQICCSFKPWVNEYGTHINVYLNEQAETTTEGDVEGIVAGDNIAKVTYHVTTHSITIGKFIKEGYTADEVALQFIALLKDEIFQNYVKETAKIDKVSTKPVWCKQLEKHFA